MSNEENIKNLKEKFLLYYSLLVLNERNPVTHDYISNIRNISEQLMQNNIYCDAFIDLEDCERLEEYLPTIENIIISLNLPKPQDVNQALWFILKYWIGRIASIKTDPIQGLQQLIGDVYWAYDFQSTTKEYLGDSHGIEHLIGIYWNYDDLREKYLHNPALITEDTDYQPLREATLKYAKEWIKKYDSH